MVNKETQRRALELLNELEAVLVQIDADEHCDVTHFAMNCDSIRDELNECVNVLG